MSTLAATPQTIGALFKNIFRAFPVLFKRLWLLFAITALIQVMVGLATEPVSIRPTSIWFEIQFWFLWLLSLYFFVTCIYCSWQALSEQTIIFKESFRYSLNRFLSFLVFGILFFLLMVFFGLSSFLFLFLLKLVSFHFVAKLVSIGVGLFCIFLFLTFLSVLFFFAPFLIILERASIFSAFKKSVQLVRGNWWRAFLILLLIYVPIIILSVLVAWPFSFRVAAASPSVLGNLLIFLVDWLAGIFLVGGLLLLFHDLKLRKSKM